MTRLLEMEAARRWALDVAKTIDWQKVERDRQAMLAWMDKTWTPAMRCHMQNIAQIKASPAMKRFVSNMDRLRKVADAQRKAFRQ